MVRAKILVVEDDDTLRQVTHFQLAREGYDTHSTVTAEDALGFLETAAFHLVLTDLILPGMSGIQLLKRVRSDHPETAVVVMTGYGTVQTAVEAMKLGASDYVSKPLQISELKALVRRCLKESRLVRPVQSSDRSTEDKCGFDHIIGAAPALQKALDIAARVAPTDATVLISGETGTGKELLAKYIHMYGTRSQRPFMTINCGAIPRELLESELFGHLKGSFTGALTHKRGKVEAANGGTVLLDEIGDMPLDLQVRILRLIQEREIEKVGATAATKVDVRIVAATHHDLAAMVREGTFREDLYYRLLVVPIHLPPLRDRPDDIEALLASFFTEFRIKHGRTDLTMRSDVLPYFLGYHWPGNVRELQNIVERMVLLSKGRELTPADLPDDLRDDTPNRRGLLVSLPQSGVSLEDFERQLIVEALKKFEGNQTRAARYLSVTRRTLAYRLEKYGLSGDALRALHQQTG